MRGLICKDKLNNVLISARILDETDNIKYEIVDDMPEIENKEGHTGKYALNSDGTIKVEYTENPLTETQLLEQRLDQIQEQMAQIAIDNMGE